MCRIYRSPILTFILSNILNHLMKRLQQSIKKKKKCRCKEVLLLLAEKKLYVVTSTSMIWLVNCIGYKFPISIKIIKLPSHCAYLHRHQTAKKVCNAISMHLCRVSLHLECYVIIANVILFGIFGITKLCNPIYLNI